MSGTITLDGKTYRITLEEMTNMKNTNMGVKQENNELPPMEQSGGKKKTRKLSPYMKFAQKARQEILKENPSMKSDIPGMGRAIGAKWRALSDAEKAKY